MYRFTYLFLLLLVFLYGLIPIGIASILGADFFIGEVYGKDLTIDILIWTIASALFLSPLLKYNIKSPRFNIYGKIFQIIGFRIYFIYLFFLIVLGIYLRFSGFQRGGLLSILSSTFIQGMGVVMLLFYLRLINNKKSTIFFIGLVFILIDILFMGKQYFIALLTLIFYIIDFKSYRISLSQLLLMLSIAILFVYIINFTRGDFLEIDFYSTLMEFRGVISSIQFARPGLGILDLNNFRSMIEKECFDIYGYNLAFHPILYFRSLGDSFLVSLTFFSILSFAFLKLSIRFLGIYGVLIFTLNFIHYLRHGIDIFFIKIIVQSLLVFLFIIKIQKKQIIDEGINRR
jgi:hypothetical protein